MKKNIRQILVQYFQYLIAIIYYLWSIEFRFHYFFIYVCSHWKCTKLVKFLCRCAASTCPLCLCIHLSLIAFVFVSAEITFSSMCNTEIASTHSTWSKTFTFLGFLKEFEFITPRITDFHTIFFCLWRGWIWIVRFWFFCSRHQFYLVIIRRSSLTENKIVGRIGGKNSAEKLKIIRHLNV